MRWLDLIADDASVKFHQGTARSAATIFVHIFSFNLKYQHLTAIMIAIPKRSAGRHG